MEERKGKERVEYRKVKGTGGGGKLGEGVRFPQATGWGKVTMYTNGWNLIPYLTCSVSNMSVCEWMMCLCGQE